MESNFNSFETSTIKEKKHELDLDYDIQEYEFGVEWHPFKSFELVTMYTYSDRKHRIW